MKIIAYIIPWWDIYDNLKYLLFYFLAILMLSIKME